MEQEITQNARREQTFSVCIHGVNDKKRKKCAPQAENLRIYTVKQLTNAFFAPAASYTFFSFYACLQGTCSNA